MPTSGRSYALALVQAEKRALEVEASCAKHLLDECAARLAAAAATSGALHAEIGRLQAMLRRRQQDRDVTARKLALAEADRDSLMQSMTSLEARLGLAVAQSAEARSENQRLQSALAIVRQHLTAPKVHHPFASYLPAGASSGLGYMPP
jgi:chromosome segregation ATPase